jgi:pyruvate/2-oxoglutarate dehydrogenase complex dihydrolipoamide acyltransferase (E2) component
MAMIQITFTPETPEQAAVVAEAIGKYLGTVPVGGTVAEVKEPAAEAPKRTRKSATLTTQSDSAASVTASTESSAEVPNEPAAAPSEPEAPAASTASSPAPVTLEEVRGVLAKLSQGGKAAEVKGLISKFGAAKLTEIPADKYADLLAAAQEL